MTPNISYTSIQQEREEESIDDLLEAMRILSDSESFGEDACNAFGNLVSRVLRQMSIVAGEAVVMETINKIKKVFSDMRMEISEQPQMSTSASSVIQNTSEQAGIRDEDTL